MRPEEGQKTIVMARNTRPTSDQFDYTVEQSPLFDRHGKPVKVGGSPIYGNFRTDNNVCLGTSTEAYEIVNNNDVVEVVEDAFGSAGMGDFEREIVVHAMAHASTGFTTSRKSSVTSPMSVMLFPFASPSITPSIGVAG